MSVFIAILAGITFGVIGIGFAFALVEWLENSYGIISRRFRPRQPRQLLRDGDWDDQNRPQKLNYNYIDWLERDLKVGKYDPDRIALGFDDTKPKPKPLDPEIDELPMETPEQFSAEESAALVDRLLADLNELKAKPKAKPVDDSWADADIRDGVYGPETRGLVRRIVDNNGNWSEIRSFGG